MILTLDKVTYAVIWSIVFHDYSYPIKDIQIRTGYSLEDFKYLTEKYDANHKYYIEKKDLPIITQGFQVLIEELNYNDFYNLIEANKYQALKLLKLLESAKEDKNLVLITENLWM